MKILEGLLFINDKDVYKEYGVFLCEDKPGAFTNYNALLKPPPMKIYTAVTFREQDGEKLPDVLPSPKFAARDITLYFGLMANTKTEWVKRYSDFVSLLKGGWLIVRLPELHKEFKMYYKECSNYEQLTFLEEESVYAARFKMKFHEPVPAI